jgi:hypothetical protein
MSVLSLGGKPLDGSFNDGQLRADLCEIATRHCYQHGSRIVDDILAEFLVTRKSIKEK